MAERTGFVKNFIMGGVSGTIAKTATAPLERVKLLLQTQEKSTAAPKYTGMTDCLQKVYREQGLASFWRGNTSNIVRIFPTQALNMSFKQTYKDLFVRHTKEDNFWMFFLETLASGGAAGATSLSVVYPLDFARTLLAADSGKGSDRKYKGLVDCCSQIYNKGGMRGLYRGFGPSVAGIIVHRAAFFGLYDTAKAAVYKSPNTNTNPVVNFALGFGVETAAGCIAYPIDTIRRRLMMQTAKNEEKYKNSMDCCRQIIRNEGVSGLYKGCLSNIMRGVGGAMVLTIYDEMKKMDTKKAK